MASFTEGNKYQFALPDGQVIVLLFKGFEGYMEPVWIDPASGQKVQLPPFRETLKKTSKSGEIRLSHELNG